MEICCWMPLVIVVPLTTSSGDLSSGRPGRPLDKLWTRRAVARRPRSPHVRAEQDQCSVERMPVLSARRGCRDAVSAERREQVHDAPVGIPQLRIALAPERVPRVPVSLSAGVCEFSIQTVEHLGRVVGVVKEELGRVVQGLVDEELRHPGSAR